ncbi:MAG: hypothetical protein JWM78_3560 [Verrucomicrobiaceae bacterium]|nr:hypothetical protein [Verrucomicrobiaceae bacterium]
MAISWLTALKILPWGDMIEYAPKVVSGAQKVWQRVKNNRDGSAPIDPNSLVPVDPLTELQLLQREVQTLQAEQVDLTNVIKELAAQNQRLVDAVGVLRVRTRLLLIGGLVNILALVALAAWSGSH